MIYGVCVLARHLHVDSGDDVLWTQRQQGAATVPRLRESLEPDGEETLGSFY